ncbi:hypothetical protein [Glaciimonas sp. PAMC28666]|uniref:hypothetical protein n=1 Tax=Glaciimonas sp. PAMC28666 TaxID=2807626 RepID=UPI0019666B20|nr:hypothetical protein [Glaciimonas sp. PAMC28666]QRX83929.1 hypothetical protein JQN73_06850 [Glaciimonas sp. PAMC28666]
MDLNNSSKSTLLLNKQMEVSQTYTDSTGHTLSPPVVESQSQSSTQDKTIRDPDLAGLKSPTRRFSPYFNLYAIQI